MSGPLSIFDSPRPAQPDLLAGSYIQTNLNYGLRIWWAFYWRSVLPSIIFIVVFNFLLRQLWLTGKLPENSTAIVSFILRFDSYAVNYIFAFFSLALVLRKRFGGFRIALLSNHGGEGAQDLPPTFARTARVWWTFCWRSIVYRLIITVAVMFPLGWIMSFLVALIPSPGFVVAVNAAVQFLLDAVVGIVVIYSAILDEDISDFRVALMPRAESAGAVAAPAAPGLQQG